MEIHCDGSKHILLSFKRAYRAIITHKHFYPVLRLAKRNLFQFCPVVDKIFTLWKYKSANRLRYITLVYSFPIVLLTIVGRLATTNEKFIFMCDKSIELESILCQSNTNAI